VQPTTGPAVTSTSTAAYSSSALTVGVGPALSSQPSTSATRTSMPTNGTNPTHPSKQKTATTTIIQNQGTGNFSNDETLHEWPDNDFRMFVGNIDPALPDEALQNHFANRFPSFQKARIIREPKTGISKGYGFVSFANALELARALREMDQTWLGSRPIRVRRVPRKQQQQQQQQPSKVNTSSSTLPLPASSMKKKHKKK
jgi:RNA recognition motif-containing protein